MPTVSGIVFLVVQTAILFFAAAMIHAYSGNAHGAIQRLNRQTEQMTELAHTDSLDRPGQSPLAAGATRA